MAEFSISEVLQHALQDVLAELREKGFDTTTIKTLGIKMEFENGKVYKVDVENLKNPQIDIIYNCY